MPSSPGLMSMEQYGCEPQTVTDADGRAEFTLPRSRFWIAASDADGLAHALVDTAAGTEPLELALAWQPFAIWSVRVERKGEVVPGAWFDCNGSRWIDGTPIPPEAELLPLQWLGQFQSLLVGAGSADSKGNLRVRYAPTGVATLFGRVRAPERRGASS